MKITAEQLRLCAVADPGCIDSKLAEQLLAAGVSCIQLRENGASEEAFLALAQSLRPVCTKYNVPLVIYNNVKVALACGADGIHLGQDGPSPADVRKQVGPDMFIGGSAHSVSEAMYARMLGVDYLTCGPVFGSADAPEDAILDRPELWRICKAVGIPVVAIGGVNTLNMNLLTGTGVCGIAANRAIFAAADVQVAASELRTLAQQISNYQEQPPVVSRYGRRRKNDL